MAFIDLYGQSNQYETYLESEFLKVDSLVELKNYSAGLSVLEQLEIFVSEEKGNDHADCADVLSYKAEIFVSLKKFTEATELYQRVLAIRRKLPDEQEGCFSALNNLGNVYRNMGLLNKSEIALVESVQIYRNLFGNDAPNLAIALNNLGGLYKDMGNYEKAEKSYLEALRINEHNYGENAIQNAIVFNNLGGLYRKTGSLKLAEFYFIRLYDLLLLKAGPTHPKFGSAINNLAVLYSELGDYKKAEILQLKALELGVEQDTASYITNCINIATLYSKMHEFEKAETYMLRAIELQNIFFPENHLNVSSGYSVLGNIYADMKNYAESEKYLQITAERYAISPGIKSHEYGTTLISIAGLKFSQQKFPEACEMANKGLIIVRESLGDNHVIYAALLKKVAYIFFKAGKTEEAGKIYSEFVAIQKEKIKAQFTFLSEVEKELYLNKIMDGFDEFYEFSLKTRIENPAIVGEVYDLVLNTKGILLKSATLVRSLILNSNDQQLIDDYEIWVDLKKQIVYLYNLPVEKRKKDPLVMEKEAELMEKEITKRVVNFSDMNQVMNESWRDLQTDLSKNEALVEFIHFNIGKDSTVYCALVLKSNSVFPEMIPLFEEKQLLRVINNTTNNGSIEKLYGTRSRKNADLYNIIWKPLENVLSGIKKVHVSPTGQLHKISFAGLSKDDGSYLIDKMEINTMASTAYYNHDATFSASENMSISLFGGINYSSDSSSSYPWQYLNGTKSETDALARSYKNYTGNVNYLTGDKATKSNFLSVASNSNILHIATHGFFFPDPKEFYESLIDSAESGDIKFRGGPATRATDLYVNSENPLMRSGLIFAGANDYWNGTQTNAEDNGIITALDVVNLNLSKTKLVVMSACESGLGDIVGGEGVYGLQRAFKMAGADFIIMSLWQVPDKETAEFMQVFYSLLYKEKDIRASFLQTQSIMRKKYDPYYWAAFVLIE
jgi:CHAT domain-containing protein/Flp pilus assembly protein TadD